jgi:hypothetical protein
VPLATYDWEQDRFGGWLAAEVAQITGVKQSAVEHLISEQRLFVLLDGIDDVPNGVTLTEQTLPDPELPIIDRHRDRRTVHKTNPRQKLISNLAKLPGFVLTARHGDLLEEERQHLSRYPQVRIEPMPANGALGQLRARAPQLRSLVPSEAFAEVIRSPLYLCLAGGVCGEHGETPDRHSGLAELERWLWDRYLHYRLASREMQELGWEPAQFRRWLVHCAGALPLSQQALSLRRWPLLYPGAVRSCLRLARSALSGLLVAFLALAFMKPDAAAICGAACAGAFLFAGEGAATRPLAIQRFGARRFWRKAAAEGWYAVTFVVIRRSRSSTGPTSISRSALSSSPPTRRAESPAALGGLCRSSRCLWRSFALSGRRRASRRKAKSASHERDRSRDWSRLSTSRNGCTGAGANWVLSRSACTRPATPRRPGSTTPERSGEIERPLLAT